MYIKKYISYFILERSTQFVVSLRDRWRDIYSESGLIFVPYLLPGARGANACTPFQAVSSETSKTPLLGCLSLARLSILWTLSKSDRVVFISRGLLPVTHLLDRPDPTHCYPTVYKSQLDSLSKHTGSLGTNRKSMSHVI